MVDFVHLHVHTEYSLLDGACRIKRLISAAKELGQTSIAITDHGVMYGAVDFYKEANEQGIKPIIGCEVYVAPRSRHDKTKGIDNEYRHLVLLAKDNNGYKNLIKLVSIGFTEGFYIKPRIDLEVLTEYKEGLIALSACLAGEIPKALINGEYDRAEKFAVDMDKIFGRDNFYLELQDHGLSEQQRINPLLYRISKQTGIPVVATNDVHYIDADDYKMQNVLICIQTGRTLQEKSTLSFETNEFYLKSGDEMLQIFSTDAIENSIKIAQRCNVEFEFGKIKLPYFDIGGLDHFEYFKQRCYNGLYKFYGETPDSDVIKRLDYELNTINSMGYVDYYLIVEDFVNFAKGNGIPVGPGRGSGAGSLAAYCIGITGVDPIKYNLLFERFLNAERISMPDFDIDFCYVRRQEVIDYVIKKYGSDHVAQIVTFGTMAAKAAIRDVGRAMAIPYNICDRIAKLVPNEPGMTLDKALIESADLKSAYDGEVQVSELIDMARKVEGMPRHASTHAAGVVISDCAVSDYVPLAKNDEAIVTQYTMNALDALGLLKMDFLGLRNLTVISDTEKQIRKNDPNFNIETIPENDRDTMKMISLGQTEGVFQFESAGMKNVLTQLKPESIEDLVAVLSLFRPGPMESIPKYIYNRHHPKSVKYDTPLLEPILKVTYGCIVYQEQVMQVFRSLAGYSLGRADIVRRAMSKKKHSVMEKEREAFVFGDTSSDGMSACEGAVNRGVSQKVAEKIFDDMSAFSSYAFNKSHAAAYAIVAYRTAYLKCHYKSEYMAALLSSVLDNSGKVSGYISEATRMGVEVLPPSVNESLVGFSVLGNGIRFGLLAVKNLGGGLISSLIEERENGEYISLYNFCSRLYGKDINRRAAESLIKCGAFDSLGYNRREMLQNLGGILNRVEAEKRLTVGGQIGLFDNMLSTNNRAEDDYAMDRFEEMQKKQLLNFEKETTGIYLSGHPMQAYEHLIKKFKFIPLSDLILEANEEYYDGKQVVIFSEITGLKRKNTKSEQVMGFLQLEDMSGVIGGIVFPKTLANFAHRLNVSAVLVIKGRMTYREGREPELICEEFYSPDEYKITNTRGVLNNKINTDIEPNTVKSVSKTIKKGLYIKVHSINDDEYVECRKLMNMYKGKTPLYIVCKNDGKRYEARRSDWIEADEILLSELYKILGESNVKLVE